jgi:transposase-like protein
MGEEVERAVKTWTRPQSRRWSEREGRAMLEALARSGQTVGEFARRHELQEQRIRAWTKRFPEVKVPSPSPTFVPVRVRAKAEVVETRAAGVEVRLRGGRTVRVGVDFDADLLRRVIVALEDGASC